MAIAIGAGLLTGCDAKPINHESQTKNTGKAETSSQTKTTVTSTSRTTTTTTTTTVNSKKPYKTSRNGIEKIKEFEYFMSEPYIASDWETNYTIGYGHVIHDGSMSVEIDGLYYSSLTEEQATTLLANDLSNVFEPNLNKFIEENNIILTQEQYDACIMDSFQKGQNIWGNTSYDISNYILSGNYGSYNECLAAFLDGAENEGLINRRTKEAEIFYNGY